VNGRTDVARIRTIKPEAFVSESLAAVSLAAERTFFGLLTQVDDQGRHRDQAAIIRGLLWPLRPEHTALDVEEDLVQLAAAELICRYTAPDGKAYLHILSWHRHQKINRPSASRITPCAKHEGAETREAPVIPHRDHRADAGSPPGVLRARPQRRPEHGEDAGQGRLTEGTRRAHGGFSEPSMSSPCPDLGSGTVEQGSLPTGRTAPAATVSAQDLIREYVAACGERPPGDVIGHLGRLTKRLLDEGIAAEHVREGLRRFAADPGHPSRLPSLVNESLNLPVAGLARPGNRPTVPAHQAWTNPADVATAYSEEL
jgi:hypothetical protein